MKTSYKKWTLGAFASLAIGCGFLGAALLTPHVEALAAEDVGTPVAYINVGASENPAASEFYYENSTLATDTSTAGTAGVNAKGLGVFASYRTEASVSVTVSAGEYQVAALVDADGAITVNDGAAVSAEGKRVISTTVSATDTVTVATAENVKLYAVMVAPVDSKILMHSEWTEQQVVVYGKLLEEELTRGCPAFYSDGSVENAVTYTSIPVGVGDGSTGANENFNAVTATGRYTATDNEVDVERALIIMPEKLVYFINAGSVTDHQGPFGDDSDPYYSYNQTVFDYYKSVGSTLKNDGIPDQESTGDNVVGHYQNGWNGGDKNLPYPFNTGRVTRQSDFGTSHLGFRLPNVEAGSYRLYLGTVSYWHGRTLGIQINGQSRGNITAGPARVVHTFDIQLSAKGTVDLYITGASTNEALASFVALQKAEDVPEAAPAAITSESKVVGLTDTSLQILGVQEGARVQIYGGARPYSLIYEEFATSDKFGEEGVYTLEYGEEIAQVVAKQAKIYVVQLTAGGYGASYEFSVTDIQDFMVKYQVNGNKNLDAPEYTTGSIILTVSANATSGLDYYKVRKDYNAYEEHDLGGEFAMNVQYEVKENGSYEFVIYSLLGVSYSERIEISHIDRTAPSISVLPVAKSGSWSATGNKFSVKVSVDSVADVEKCEIVYNGEVKQTLLASELEADKTLREFDLDLTGAGEYLITVTTASKQSATASVVVGNKPVYSKMEKMAIGSDLELTFLCLDNYRMESLAVYQLIGSRAVKQSILGTNQVDIYTEGTYAVVFKTKEGTTEVYSFEITSSDFKASGSAVGGSTAKPGTTTAKGNGGESYTGTIVAACVFGAAVIALLVVLLLGKKKAALQTAEEDADIVEEEPVVIEPEKEVVKEEAQPEEAAAPEAEAEAEENPEKDDEV